jgi:hypothetical protein
MTYAVFLQLSWQEMKETGNWQLVCPKRFLQLQGCFHELVKLWCLVLVMNVLSNSQVQHEADFHELAIAGNLDKRVFLQPVTWEV